MNLPLLRLAICVALSSTAVHAGSITKKLGLEDFDDKERRERATYNEHIIAIDTDGRALEPYDFANGFNLHIPGIGPHFPKSKTRLQRSMYVDPDKLGDPSSKEFKDAKERVGMLLQAGFTCREVDARYERLARQGRKSPKEAGAGAAASESVFVFADFVVPRMWQKARASGKPVVIFVHGGMNNLDEAIKRGARLIDHAMNDNPACYPIFICWNSSFLSSWWEHWRFIRNGVDVHGDDQTWAYLTFPVYAATDIATSVVRAPRTFLDNLRSTFKSNAIHGDLTARAGRSR